MIYRRDLFSTRVFVEKEEKDTSERKYETGQISANLAAAMNDADESKVS